MKTIKILLSILLWGLLSLPNVQAQSHSDSTWERYYGNPNVMERSAYEGIETYDKAYLFNKIEYINDSVKAFLLKTDINGYKLWEHQFVYDSDDKVKSWIEVEEICEGLDNNLFLGVKWINQNHPYKCTVAKLNPCGELLWCETLDTIVNRIKQLKIDKNGDVIALAYDYNDATKPLVIIKLDAKNGNVIWHRSFFDANIYPIPAAGQIRCDALVISPSNNYYIQATCDWKDEVLNQYKVLPVYIKLSSNGATDWVLPYGEGTSMTTVVGQTTKTTLFLGSNLLSFVLDGATLEHHLLLINEAGVVIKDVAKQLFTQLYQGGKLQPIRINVDKTIFAGVYAGMNSADWGFKGFVEVDTNFHVFNFTPYHLPWFEFNPSIEKSINFINSFDNKLLAFASLPMQHGDTIDEDMYIYKFNTHFEYDSVYTHWSRPFDSLCSHPISDMCIDLAECKNIYLGLSATENNKLQSIPISIQPNPSRGLTVLSIDNTEHLELSAEVLSAQGQRIWHSYKGGYPQHFEIDTRGWAAGLYIVRLSSPVQNVGSTKFIVL